MSESPLTVVIGGDRSPGKEIVEALLSAGWRVRALVQDPRDLGPLKDRVDELLEVDFERDPAPAGAFAGALAAFSALSLTETPRWPTPWEIDGAANLALIRRAAAEGVQHYVFLSVTGGTELRFQADIAAAREQVVDMLKPLGMRWTVLRPCGTFAGLRQPFEFCRKRGAWPVLGDGSTRFNPIHPADLAELAVRALSDPALQDVALDVGGPEVFSLREMGELACAALGRRPRILPIPRGAFSLAAAGVRLYNANLARQMDVLSFLTEREQIVGRPLGRRDLRAWFQEQALSAGA